MANNTNSQFEHTFSSAFGRNLVKLFPPRDDVALEYGYGFGDSFEADYDKSTEAHSYELPQYSRRFLDDFISTHGTLPPLPPTPEEVRNFELSPTPPPPPASNTTTDTDTNLHTLPPAVDIITPPATPPNVPNAPGRGRRSKFSVSELEGLARVVYNENPYGAKHGEKKTAWDNVLGKLQEQGLFKKSSADTVKNKMSAMLAYFEVSSSSMIV